MDIKKYIIQREKVTSFSMRRKFTFRIDVRILFTRCCTYFLAINKYSSGYTFTQIRVNEKQVYWKSLY